MLLVAVLGLGSSHQDAWSKSVVIYDGVVRNAEWGIDFVVLGNMP